MQEEIEQCKKELTEFEEKKTALEQQIKNLENEMKQDSKTTSFSVPFKNMTDYAVSGPFRSRAQAIHIL